MDLWDKIDWDFVERLKSCSPQEHNEGALLHNPNRKGMKEQVELLAEFLVPDAVYSDGSCKPKILEIGTNKGLFCYLTMLADEDATIDTMDPQAWCQNPVDILNEKFGNRIKFYHGSSLEIMPDIVARVTESGRSSWYEFGWVDGKHTETAAYYDLYQCADCCHVIGLDDVKAIPDVNNAVFDFINKFEYGISRSTQNSDERGLYILEATY